MSNARSWAIEISVSPIQKGLSIVTSVTGRSIGVSRQLPMAKRPAGMRRKTICCPLPKSSVCVSPETGVATTGATVPSGGNWGFLPAGGSNATFW